MGHDVDIRTEHGAVIVTFAISLVLLMLVTSFAIDVSNFFRHKRQLQTQADAAVLAGGSALTAGCTGNGPVFTAADTYAGVPSSTYNKPKAGGDSGVITRQFITGDPCGEGALEVKVTESKVKWFFPITAIAGLLRADIDISAEARVELKQIQGQGGTLPIAVEDEPAITNAWVWLVDEDLPVATPIPGTVRRLAKGSGSATTTPWTTTSPITHDVTQSNLGVRVAIDYAKNSACATVGDTCVTLCGVGKVKCFDAASSNGLLHIHGYDRAATAAAKSPPALKNVELSAAGCIGNSAFNRGGCSYQVKATVDWVPEIDAGTVGQAEQRAAITGTLGGASVTLKPQGDTNTWVGTTSALAATGPSVLKLGWAMMDGSVSAGRACGKKTNSGGNPTNSPGGNNTPVCEGAWNGEAALGVLDLALSSATGIHRTFVAESTRSDPITAATITGSGAAVKNSVARCAAPTGACLESWNVTVDLPAELALGSHRNLSVKTPGSNDGFLDCDPLYQDPNGPTSSGKPRFIYQLANGCNGPRFAINPGDTCPPIASYGPNDPWICVASVTGDKTGAIDQGFSQRIYGTTNPSALDCAKSPNRMKDGFVASVPEEDKRIVPVMVVPTGALKLSGGTLFPVRIFAFFYLTGWDGDKDCADNEPSVTGDILGYFLHHAVPNDGSVYGTKACDPNELGGCVPVMTK